MKKIISAVLVILVSLQILSLCVSAENTVSSSNWMSKISSDTKLSAISMPGTHDSATQFVFGSPIARCQKLSIRGQLYSGARFLDIRLEEDDKGFKLVHGIADCKTGYGLLAPDLRADRVIDECYDFLDANKGETIIFSLKEDDGSSENFYEDFYNRYISDSTEKWYIENRIPKLSEVRGKIVLARRCATYLPDDISGINLSNWRDQGDQQTVPNEFNISAKEKAYVQDRYQLSAHDKWNYAVKSMLEAKLDKNTLNINFFSTAANYIPVMNAKYINSHFTDYEIQNDFVGIVLFDFANEDLCQKIYSLNDFVLTGESATQMPDEVYTNGLFPKAYELFYNFTETLFDVVAKLM